jgi:3-phenylpropionate/trans-cinnamate dioxygenase ferredoxin reductase subunit
VLADGTALDWDRLILATGARARTLPIPGATLGGVLALRSRADADALKAVIRPGARIVLVGGGYIGLEIAASATALGASVTVLEREARLLARVASQPLAGFFLERHRRAGVDIVLDARVTAIEGEGGRAAGVRLGNGTLLPADAVVIGVGAVPNDELGRAAGLACEDGIVVDERAATSDTAIFGIGDCTRRPVPRYGRSLRLESVPSAIEQGKQAAAAIMGRPAPVPEVPWFWSDQYEVRLQIAGLQLDVARTLLRGDPATGRFAVFHLAADGVIQAVEAVNAPEEYMAGRLLIGRRTVVAADRLADAGIRMKDLMAG